MSKKNKQNNLAIWKIDKKVFGDGNLSCKNIIEEIKKNYFLKETDKKQKDREYETRNIDIVPLIKNEFNNKKLLVLHRKRFSYGWKYFLGDKINTDIANDKNKNIFTNTNNDFVCFIYDENDIFAITSGAGYFIIQDYIDDSFPLDIAKKIFLGKFKYKETRDLTSVTYTKAENYRRTYSFSKSETFGQIWKKLMGEIDKDVIKSVPELSLIFDINSQKAINAEMKSSFTFRKSVTFEEIIQLINAIQKLPPQTKKSLIKLSFLDSLKEESKKDKKDKLQKALLKKIFTILRDDKYNEAGDFDFCHPVKVFDFFAGQKYSVNNIELPYTDYPSAEDVLKFIKEKNIVNLTDFDEFSKCFQKLTFSFSKTDNDFKIEKNLTQYFHGEVEHNNTTYFLVDGKWYKPMGTFLDSLSNMFIDEIFGADGVFDNSVPFMEWNKNTKGKYIENKFNKEQSKVSKNFYLGDKIFILTGNGEIELFDLLYVQDKKLFIIQVKNGFGASVRDACSQIQIAADIIEDDIKNGGKERLKEYYKKWSVEEDNNLSEKQFLRLFDREREYVLAFATKHDFSKKTFESNKLKSSIAKFELIGLANEFRAKQHRALSVQHITKK
ncbi:TIGR04141 family sporadically distributed protein [Candidatus Parcubacteria bacterium]|nr:TIGR04141 family sporadically distributed protein [Candidatus Parcubacteria bacterium]